MGFLQQLCNAHSTSGKEEEVFCLMKQCFERNNWKVYGKENYMIANRHFSKDMPTILLTAHADSPGWKIDNPMDALMNDENLFYKISSIGDISSYMDAEVVIKTEAGKMEGNISNGYFFVKKGNRVENYIKNDDRICFKPKFLLSDNILEATFLDNRMGCFLLSKIADECDNWDLKYNITLAVTASEETGGSGADELAGDVDADLVIVLDTTYEEKNVTIGSGPVLTLQDYGIQLDSGFAEKIIHVVSRQGINLQTEITHGYTETVSFAELSKFKKVLSLLIAQRNNHSNNEQVDIRDIDSYFEAIRILCCTKLPLCD